MELQNRQFPTSRYTVSAKVIDCFFPYPSLWTCLPFFSYKSQVHQYRILPDDTGQLSVQVSIYVVYCIKASFYILENRPNVPTTKGFKTIFFMKLGYQFMTIFFNF